MSEGTEFSQLIQANTPFEAAVLVGILESAGIPARVEGGTLVDEFAGSQRLMNLGGVKVLVPRSSLEAASRAIAEAKEAGKLLEESEGEIEAQPDGQVEAEREREPRASVAAPGQPSQGASSSSKWMLLLIVAVVGLSAALFYAWDEISWWRGADRLTRTAPMPDGWRGRWWDNDQLAFENIDKDKNGIYEKSTWFNRDGVRVVSSFDANENGMYERSETYGPDGKVTTESEDRDENGLFEIWREHYPDGSRSEWHDKDHDGLFDVREFFDASGKLVLTEENRHGEGYVRKK